MPLSTPGPVRVRIAPSPTGEFHVGTARTSLWNWLFARQHSGAFVLRIEDTDEVRNEPQWYEGIRSALRWLELDWDEEYLQSDNAAAHRAAAERLYAEGRAYYCDCTPGDVASRKPAGAPPGYDGFCRERSLPQAPGRALRFRVPDGLTVIDDVVRGRVEFDNAKLGGDFVIVKGNGGPIFYLANTIDDLDERITHVLRGEEHLPNAPKNQLLWEALAPAGQPPPVWAHLPNLVNEQRKKLSKRRDKTALESYRDEGILMEAIRNYVCLLGWAPGGDREYLTLEEMLAEFRLEDVNSSPAFFDVKKLASVNQHYIQAMSVEGFIKAAEPFLAAGPWTKEDFRPEVFARLAPLVQERTKLLGEVPAMIDFVFLKEPAIDEDAWTKAIETNALAPQLLGEASAAYAATDARDWVAPTLHTLTLEIGQRHGLALGKAQAPIRVAVTGRTVGPPLFESLEVLGQQRSIARIDAAIGRLAGMAIP